SLLHRGEARAALLVQRADLPVDDAFRAAHRERKSPCDRREPAREVVAVARNEARLAGPHVPERPVAVPLHLEQPVRAGGQLVGERREHGAVVAPTSRGRAVTFAHEEPVLLLAVQMRRDERPQTLETLAVQVNGQPAVALLLDEVVRPRVPDLDRAGAVFALRYLALEGCVVEWVIFDVDGERADARLEWNAFRHGPGGQHAVALEPEVVVEPARIVALDDEDGAPPPGAAPAAERLGRLLRVAFSLVFAELLGHPGVLDVSGSGRA